MFGKKKKDIELPEIKETVDCEVEAWDTVHKELCNFMGTMEVKLEELLASDPETEEEKDLVTAEINACAILLDQLDDVENRFKGHIRASRAESKRKDLEEYK